ncbi:CoA-transferase family III domain-containing protein [Staphylotrichum tortipilum]|uniref:CoA-transferase family III domain-containing protein n=1 Tax=Staphylotrichum tortipilum TaxID=2831512 RepID=A0AAN6MI19_9PEZI|nr:CoA-transferase family III domain-containing protein [Staphylotrichum longicolle]
MASTFPSLLWSWGGDANQGLLYRDGVGEVSQESILLAACRNWQRLAALKNDLEPTMPAPHKQTRYSVAAGARDALRNLAAALGEELSEDIMKLTGTVELTAASEKGDFVHFPTPLRAQEAVAAIKAVEGCAAAAIAKLRYGQGKSRRVQVDLDKVSAFLMSAYITTLDGMDKTHPEIKERIPDTDLKGAQSNLYRRLSANLYRTANPNEYYHIHGSLDADTTLRMLGLPTHDATLTSYHAIIARIGAAVAKHTAAELDALNLAHSQAGIQALTWPEFRATPHGQAILSLPPFTVRPNPLDTTTPPVPFPPSTPSQGCLAGIKVLELCRIIAGPTIGRALAAHGASVLKVTCASLPDVPFFQLDVNAGKHTAHLNLRLPADRAVFSSLLKEADVLVDGYRPGALARLGYGPDALGALAAARGRGFVYVAEDCFGGSGVGGAEWAGRAGWQQIADCVTGVARAQGAFMRPGRDAAEPVVPPFPMSDYATGALGAAAALAGLMRRATEGGSWVCRTSLVQYDAFLMGLGMLPGQEQERLRGKKGFFGLRYYDSVDEVGRRALEGMRGAVPHLFEQGGSGIMREAWSEGFGGVVRWPREAVRIQGVRVSQVRMARPNGEDGKKGLGGWDGWGEEIEGEDIWEGGEDGRVVF